MNRIQNMDGINNGKTIKKYPPSKQRSRHNDIKETCQDNPWITQGV